MMSPKEKIDSVWNSIWKDILENPDGTPDMESIKRELCDYVTLFHHTQTTYSMLTGGEITNPFTPTDVLVAYADSYYQEMAISGTDVEVCEDGDGGSILFQGLYNKATVH